MQPRQRSKCSTTVGLSRSVPWAVFSISWIRPRGESISSLQSTYVGQVGRQKPQWTHARVSSSITRALRPGRAAASARGGARRAAPPRHAADAVRDVRDARRRADDRLVERREDVGEVGRGRTAGDRARCPGARAPRPRRASSRPRRRRARVPRRAAPSDRSFAPSKQHRDPPWVEHVERARLELRAPERAHDAGRVVGLDDEGRRGGWGSGWRRSETRAISPSRPSEPHIELAEVVAGDVLHDLAARARDRAVAEDERHAEDEVARRAEAVRERPGEPPGEAGADRRVARAGRARAAGRPAEGRRRARRAGSRPRRCT